MPPRPSKLCITNYVIVIFHFNVSQMKTHKKPYKTEEGGCLCEGFLSTGGQFYPKNNMVSTYLKEYSFFFFFTFLKKFYFPEDSS